MDWWQFVALAFIAWFTLVLLFTPRIDYHVTVPLRPDSDEFVYVLQSACQAAIHRDNRVQIFTNVGGKPLDRPEFEGFFAAMDKIGKPIWIHPERGANHPDYRDEEKSLYEIWWTFGWPYETSVAMSRLVFSKTLDKYPRLKIIVHHLGAMVPYHEGRVGPGWDQLGKRTTDEDYFALLKSLRKRPLDYFKQDFNADSAVFGSRAATVCGLEFYGADRVVFASDCPFDPEGGTQYIRETIKIIDGLDIPEGNRHAIYHGNAERLMRLH